MENYNYFIPEDVENLEWYSCAYKSLEDMLIYCWPPEYMKKEYYRKYFFKSPFKTISINELINCANILSENSSQSSHNYRIIRELQRLLDMEESEVKSEVVLYRLSK
jgi:hypothetical protein